MNYKSLSLAVLASLALLSCKKENQVHSHEAVTEQTAPAEPKVIDPNAKFGTMEFANLEYNFGDISEDNVVETVFKFTNTGEADLVISNAKGSCGCTVPDFPKTPIKPGESHKIDVKFDSQNRRGFQNKSVTIISNAQPNIQVLRIKAEIVLPEEAN